MWWMVWVGRGCVVGYMVLERSLSLVLIRLILLISRLTHLGVQLGYLVLEKDDPVKLDTNKGTAFFRETVMKAGCCGLREMLKMHAFKLKQYKKVVARSRSPSLIVLSDS